LRFGPQTNGVVERFNQSLKSSCCGGGIPWTHIRDGAMLTPMKGRRLAAPTMLIVLALTLGGVAILSAALGIKFVASSDPDD